MSKFSRFYSFPLCLLISSGITYGGMSASVAEVVLQQEQQVRSSQSSHQNTVNNTNNIPNNNANNVGAYTQFGTKDNLNSLIDLKQRAFEQDVLAQQQAHLVIEEQRRINRRPQYPNAGSTGILVDEMDFNRWLNASVERRNSVARYREYLAAQLGSYNVPPMQQLLTTARSWAQCGYEPYQLPPEYLWPNMINTLRLYAVLRQQGILPPTTQIRSVYRSPDLNDCAGGAASSKHMTNGAIDIWVPEYEGNEWQINQMQNNLCDFWGYQGQYYEFGLGLYSTGSIHIDTQGYRKWGSSHSSASSPCRFDYQ
ncbi:D-Ala-D-Ala carboxypeptidase family metallohydrolase [Psychrobacter sp. I-STPA10]|uniref:D-Ala-D-Ala carboxypeptidase family metallohydrolase n=1 Tax=Psychrobacter sp. I-STPA10 TaxID=2585769 RepID=UPI001E389661|nr:D-Ala-D-Ala carboxypeptidase family metallohydrolase [Psychrobacter sp. I-STPA10]